ncbi:iron dependent repressor [Xanthomonas campestris pv. campestris]|nr:iron dependent repressor [Xanthomonas campestris pv. campestris]WDJ57906.1 iron dependent repressor [Xanthomonas campestris pv. campestris]WDK52014.1 iron dependent repressor [Xanthomonas campestris pv. campestris]WDK56021.1 iron dependent repressor [Xanthomonas campestris pv. campestris]WDL52552.1 iron dependent repressor [Xanthomonas campestris pv. campestris]
MGSGARLRRSAAHARDAEGIEHHVSEATIAAFLERRG